MNQDKRGYENTVLYKGSDESDFSDMYAEIVMNFPELREEGVHSNILVDYSSSVSPSDLKDGVDYLGIGNGAIVNVGEKNNIWTKS